MGNTLTFDNEEQLVLLTNNSNSISPLKRSHSNLDLKSGLSSRTNSLQCITNYKIENSISNIICKISERILKTNGIIYFFSKVEKKEIDLNQGDQDILYEPNYIFETLDLMENRAQREVNIIETSVQSLKIEKSKEAQGNFNREISFEFEKKESIESSEISKSDIDSNFTQNSASIFGNNTSNVPKSICVTSKKFIIFGNKNNHKPFLSPGIIDLFLPYILDETLLSCFLVCPHWLLTISEFINEKYCISIDDQFKETYGKYLDLEHSTITIQPVLTVGGSVRIDRVLYAKVLKSCINKTTCLSYSFKYKSNSQIKDVLKKEGLLPQKNLVGPIIQPLINNPNSCSQIADTPFISCYKFVTNKIGTKRIQWAHKDLSRCHCEEFIVAQTTTKSNVNVGDRIEIAINFSNSFGIVDIESIRFLPIQFETITPEKCEIEDIYTSGTDWRFYTSEDGEITECFDIPNLLPQFKVISLEYAGTDIITCKITYKAISSGDLANSKEHFGVDISVVPREYSIISALKRKGLQHDRYSPLQMRVDDQLVLYISKGGAIPT
ncbi:uncharacterized protein cubi_01382 [Cryptosporidium ubiquitum]|uniref:Uncharacterized protein n=1 Tax=Cryptosporidium ubiquitum TaxID=857276 RepID=A0A1J4MCU1_9CRYT|nr:uncharacterized protein cubi_01382 [Cryptosporidium ubiquitum]OII72049.1 hypothetical protein cubi_01382 [Cryptosporidium ubiquitum]